MSLIEQLLKHVGELGPAVVGFLIFAIVATWMVLKVGAGLIEKQLDKQPSLFSNGTKEVALKSLQALTESTKNFAETVAAQTEVLRGLQTKLEDIHRDCEAGHVRTQNALEKLNLAK